MKFLSLTFCLTSLLSLHLLSSTAIAQKAEQYELSEDSKVQEGVPQGEIKGPFRWKNSTIFPGTERDYSIYIPAQYDADTPCCLLVVQDGLRKAQQWKFPTVLDNLIHKKQVPPMIGVFISPGVVPAPNPKSQPRFNRSFEYDGMGDSYARFLLTEVLPAVGKQYNISDDPNDRMIAGSSSGAICAFTAAWERPDSFRRVFSAVGTFVSLRGGNEYPALVRKFEAKPIRIFLQDGSNDLDIYGGNLWDANQVMLRSLQFAGYDVMHAWGEGGHNGQHSTAILPDAMRWLWRDYPKPVTVVQGKKRRTDVLIPGEDWRLVGEGYKYAEGPAVNADGEVFFSDVPNSRIYRIGLDGKVSLFAENTQRASGLMFSANGKLYACQSGAKRIVCFDKQGKSETVVEDVTSNDIVMLPQGGYFTDPLNNQVWHFTLDGEKKVVAKDIEFPNGLHTSTDHAFLLVNDSRGRFNFSFQVQPDGSLVNRQLYGHLHRGDADKDCWADGMTIDSEGRTYVATRVGLQVLDQLGRVHLIINKPQAAKLSNVVFGGPDLDTIYATSTDKVYRRKLKARGVVPWKGAVKPPRPGL
jgi:gluconolactonase